MTELHRFVEATSDGFLALRGGRVMTWNRQAAELVGWPVEDGIGRTLVDVLGVPASSQNEVLAAPGVEAGAVELTAYRKDGTELTLKVVTWAATDDDDADIHVLLQDLTAKRRAERELQSSREELAREATELWHRAFHDPLTNLANRNLLHDRVDHALARRGDGSLAVMLVDLDGFKAINDALGHAVGDELLIAVADRLKSCMRPADTVSRPGGDEFALLLDDVEDPERACAAAQRVLDQMATPFMLNDRSLVISASIGIAVCRPGDLTVEELLGNADVALYRAKAGGRGCYSLFDPSMQAAALARLELEADLRGALERGELEVHYQAVGTLREGRISGVEALVRWQHPVRGMVPPLDFIPLAEDTGLILRLGEWVLGEACRQATRWHREMPDVEPMSMAVNVSGKQIRQPGFVGIVAEILDETELDADHLVLEITESLLMEETGTTLVNLRALRALGVRLSIDDFGTGYSSLARLRAFPVDELKIDRSFINALDGTNDDAPLVAAVISMAHSLGLEVVGEGVESAPQLEFLRDHGCDRVQGYLLGRPAPAHIVSAMLREPAAVLRLAAARAVLGDAGAIADVDVMEALATAVTERGDLAQVAAPLLATVATMTGMESVYLTRIHWDTAEQEIFAAHNTGPVEVPVGAVLAWEAEKGGYNDARLMTDLGFDTYVSVPLIASGGGRLGTLCAAAHGRMPLRKDHLAVMELFGRVMADEIRARVIDAGSPAALAPPG